MSAERLASSTTPLALQIGLRINWRAFADDEPLQKVLSYVLANADEVLSLTEAAEVAGMSRSKFARYFHKTAGVPYKHWFDFLRVKRAITILRFTSKSMLEVAEEFGFEDATTFTRTFRRIEGVTPRDFRAPTSKSGPASHPGRLAEKRDESPKNWDESPRN